MIVFTTDNKMNTKNLTIPEENDIIMLSSLGKVDFSMFDNIILSDHFKHHNLFYVKEISWSDIIATQICVYAYKVKQLIDEWPSWKDKFLLVKEENGRFYLQDGHHRWAAFAIINRENPKEKIKCSLFKSTYSAMELMNSGRIFK